MIFAVLIFFLSVRADPPGHAVPINLLAQEKVEEKVTAVNACDPDKPVTCQLDVEARDLEVRINAVYAQADKVTQEKLYAINQQLLSMAARANLEGESTATVELAAIRRNRPKIEALVATIPDAPSKPSPAQLDGDALDRLTH